MGYRSLDLCKNVMSLLRPTQSLFRMSPVCFQTLMHTVGFDGVMAGLSTMGVRNLK